MMAVKNKLRSYLTRGASYLRERRVRMPSLRFALTPGAVKARTPEAKAAVREIRRAGIVKLPGFVPQDLIEDMQAGIERMVSLADRKHADLESLSGDPEQYEAAKVALRKSTYTDQGGACYFDPDHNFYACQDAFQFSSGLARFVMREDFLAIANSYYGRPALLTRASSHRFLPGERPRGLYGWAWHHDGWGRKVNAMILLSKITEADQHMAYKQGSHRHYRGYLSFQQATFSDEEVERRWPECETLRCVGEPGDVFIFDSNGLHSAMATMGDKRDHALVMTYSDPTYVYGQTLPGELMANGADRSLSVFRETIRYNEFRKREGMTTIFPRNGKNWPSSLKYVNEWLF